MTGYFVISKAGHDAGQIYVVLGGDERYALLCDGKYKTVAKPKKKSWKHIQKINSRVEDALYTKMLNHESFYDEEIKYALKIYQANTNRL